MNIQNKLEMLIREKELARRRLKLRPWFFKLLPNEEFWIILSRLTGMSYFTNLKKSNGNTLFDIFLPPPSSFEDNVLWKQSRSLREIETDISALAHPVISITEGDAFVSKRAYVAVLELDKYSLENLTGYGTVKHSSLIASLLGKHQSQVDGSAKFIIQFNKTDYPHRSCIQIREKQNDDGHRVAHGGQSDAFGRHFEVSIVFSKQMMAAILGLLEELEKPPWQREREHILLVPIEQSLVGRSIRVSSHEEFLRFEKSECRTVSLVYISKNQVDPKIDRALTLYEAE